MPSYYIVTSYFKYIAVYFGVRYFRSNPNKKNVYLSTAWIVLMVRETYTNDVTRVHSYVNDKTEIWRIDQGEYSNEFLR